MKFSIPFILCFSFLSFSTKTNLFAQDTKQLDKMLAELSEEGCKCLGKINTGGKTKEETIELIKACIEEETNAYHLGKQFMSIEVPKNEEKTDTVNKTITISLGNDSPEYLESYREVEKYLMDNCPALKSKLASNDEESSKSVSRNPAALEVYDKGIKQMEEENYKKALNSFQKAVDIDPTFAFAWDNLGICYRRLENYDKAIECYNKSLEIDPNGMTPLQNLAVAYQFKKEYKKAIGAYERLAEIDENNPEIYYGIGLVYAVYLSDFEEGLLNMCKAYNLYTEQQSPYRTDAEKLINAIYTEMKKQGKEDRFNEILKENNITPK